MNIFLNGIIEPFLKITEMHKLFIFHSLVVLVFDAASDRTDIVVLDAANISEPPIATIHLKHHIPFGLHGNFTPEIWHRGK
jgi:hypothetical protein